MIVDISTLDRETVVTAMARMESELFGRGAWSENAVRQELDAPARTYVVDVAPENGEQPCNMASRAEGDHEASATVVRGYAGFWYDGDDAEIMTIGVDSAYQQQGIATAMLQRLIDEATAQGANRILLEVRVDNEPALALYRRFGFQRMGLRKRYYQPEGVDAYTMSLDLKPRIVGFAVNPAQPTTEGVTR